MGRLDCWLAERLVAELRGGSKVEVLARSNLVTLSALCRPRYCVGGVENDSEAFISGQRLLENLDIHEKLGYSPNSNMRCKLGSSDIKKNVNASKSERI